MPIRFFILESIGVAVGAFGLISSVWVLVYDSALWGLFGLAGSASILIRSIRHWLDPMQRGFPDLK
jgi:hypothetical protein